MVGKDPSLGPLADNGGRSFTHALLSGSPAIDAGDNVGAPATDQRGVARPQGTAVDIGAVEFASTPPALADLSVTLQDNPDPVTVGSNLVYTVTVKNDGPAAATGVVVTNLLPANVTFVSASAATVPVQGVLVFQIGTLPAGSNSDLTIEVLPTVAGIITNSVVVAGGPTDPNLLNNVARESTTVSAIPACSLVVVNTNDSGPGSLRAAIECANATPRRDTISFNIPGPGVHTIAPLSPLPSIMFPVVIDGYTQPGSSLNTLTEGDNAVLLIEVRGDLVSPPFTRVLEIFTGDCVIRGIVINRLVVYLLHDGNVIEGNLIGTDPSGQVGLGGGIIIGDGDHSASFNVIGGRLPSSRNVISGNGVGTAISIQGPTHTDSHDNLVLGNYIGTDASGTHALPNQWGLYVYTSNNRIGDTAPEGRNIISGNIITGLIIQQASSNVVVGNFFGTDVTGRNPIPNSTSPGAGDIFNPGAGAIHIAFSDDNVIGGTHPGAFNVISGNDLDGIQVVTSSRNLIQGNLIGTASDGITPLPNVRHGIFFRSDGITFQSPTNNIVGGAMPAARNVIAFNGGNGIFVPKGTNDSLLGNSIFSNAALGINLVPAGVFPSDGVTLNDAADPDTGANNLQNFPVFTSAVSGVNGTRILCTLNSTPGTSFTIEFFSNRECDPSGFGEGETFLGRTSVTTEGSGNAAIDTTVPARVPGGQVITSTATDPDGNTSEFSQCISVEGPAIKLITDLLSPIELNRQTGLFEQKIRLSNLSTTAVSAARVFVQGLAARTQLYNASGSSNNVPFVTFNESIAPGAHVDFLLEYYFADRAPVTNLTFGAEEVIAAPNLALVGNVLSIDRNIQVRDGRLLIEFTTIPGRTYAIQYSGDMQNWKTVIPSITAPANHLQWLDDGPPKTESKPSQLGSRFYRVLELP